MQRRKLRVLTALEELCSGMPAEVLNQYEPAGFSAEQVAMHCGLSRSNTSSDLNQLHRDGAVVKTVGRPTYYLAFAWVKKKFPRWSGIMPYTIQHHRELGNLEPLNPVVKQPLMTRQFQTEAPLTEKSETVFENLVGAEGSLQNAIEQAKSAVLYPPKGLDTLLVGPTGVGKTLFAEYMFAFAQKEGRVRPGGQMVVFNCADYAHNPQLLLSQLFGHVRGAFTGAEKEKAGLVEKADGGMLFLDEIHRMPPEGQEMLFYLLDKGQFRRMGEVENKRQVQLMMVGATTEEPDSFMLKTFLRRIPMVISLPELNARPMRERLQLVKYLLAREAAHIQADIVVDREAVLALLIYECPGNIGQLRNDLQIICAKVFLTYIRQKQNIFIDREALPAKVRQSATADNPRHQEAFRLVSRTGRLLVPAAADLLSVDKSERLLPVDFYQQLANRVNFLERQGLDDEEVVKCIEVDIDQYFRQIYPRVDPIDPDYLPNLVPPAFIPVLDQACSVVADLLNKAVSERLYQALAIHIVSSLQRIERGQVILNPKLPFIARTYPQEMKAAKQMAAIIGAYANMDIPEEETGFIALMLATLEESAFEENSRVGIMVIAHGKSTASSLVDFANKLLGVSSARAIDMSMELCADDIFPQAIALAKEVDEGKGIVLLVDMGSLSGVGAAITQETGIPVKTVDMVTTAVVLHTMHKALLANNGLDEVYRAAWSARSAWGLNEEPARSRVL
ncbi:phosphotransferase system mannose-type iia component [Lucifera butyrica]|uniref:Phosphotransferase system mannose-type iia component n=1 Tax=Lucifera butyrica TaxID=1351585 RepID=A0A498R1Z1_9FIRM|nr:sigma-54-dependent transcriptional regulator [Lucifera butyrica]VBB06636.1 phosphotransferase system mannose-type iia component [Lucifera butyrica]